MATRTRINVTEDGEVTARFVVTDDAMLFAAAATEGNDRTLYVTDAAGWVNITYRNGFAVSGL